MSEKSILYRFEDAVVDEIFETICNKIDGELEVRGFYGDTTSTLSDSEVDDLINECIEAVIYEVAERFLYANYDCAMIIAETAFYDWEEYGSFSNIRDCAIIAMDNYIEECQGSIAERIKNLLKEKKYI